MRTDHIVVVIEKRLFNRFADCLQARKVDDGLALMLAQGSLNGRLVTNITSDQRQFSSSDLLNPLKCFWVAVAEVVENDHFVTSLKEFDAGVGTNVPGTARNEYAHTGTPSHPPIVIATALGRHMLSPKRLCNNRFTSCSLTPFVS